jgi:hypothetical protein
LPYDIIEAYAKPDGSYPYSKKPEYYTDFTTNHNGVSTRFASKIYLSLQGDSVKTIVKNDSIACYYLKLKNVYVQYEPKGVYEIFIEANTKMYFFTTEKPVVLMFLKRHGSLYFILLTAEADGNLDPELLNKLVRNQ